MITLRLSANGNHIVGFETTYDADGFAIEDKMGAIAIDPSKDAKALLEKAKKLKWEIVEDDNGFGRLVRA